MSISVSDFWKLAVRSRVVSHEEAKKLHATFVRTPGAVKNANAMTMAEWLISIGILSRFQAKQLLTGQSRPFVYGDYKVFDHVANGPLAGLFRAVHSSTGQSAMLFFWDSNGDVAFDWATAQQQAQATLTAKYPQAGRVFGMVEAEKQRFLVLEDVGDKIGATAAPANFSPQYAAPVVQATPQPALARPIPVPKKEPSPFEFDKPNDLPSTDPFSIPDPPIAYVKKKSSGTTILVGGGFVCVALIVVAVMVLLRTKQNDEKEPKKAKVAEANKTEAEIPASEQPIEKTDPTPPIQPVTPVEPSKGATPEAPAKTTAVAPTKPVEPIKPVERTAPSTVEIADDGETLWASPTQGPPVDLRYLADGAQMFLILRPSSLLDSEEGEKVFGALGPRGVAASDYVKAVIGVDDLTDIERLLVAFYPVDGAPPQTAFVVTLRKETSKEKLLQAWHNPNEVGKQKKFYQSAQWAYYIPPETNGRVFAVGQPNLIGEMVEMAGPPALRKEMEKLLRGTDDTRQVTLLLVPNFLFADGQTILSGDMAKLKSPLLAYLGEEILAVELSFHLTGENFFGELRVYGALDTSPYELAEMYRKRLSDFPTLIEEYLAKLNPHEYGRLILTRMPRMIGELAAYTRIGDENKHAVLRWYLPAAAAHNLTLATEVALSERPGNGIAGTPETKKPTTVAEALKKKISLSFPRNTLEKCLELWGDEIDVPVHIEGKDLQLEGITKNQSFELNEQGKPADEILRIVMLKANPDGKLVYVIKPLEPGGKDVVFITTRAAVAKRGDKLPPELEQAATRK